MTRTRLAVCLGFISALSTDALLARYAADSSKECGVSLVQALPSAMELVRPGDLVTAQRGDLPVIIVAPHGGVVTLVGVPERTKGVTVLDDGTAELALLTAQRITGKLGGKPYLVIAQLSRKYADLNRDATEAYEDDRAKVHYDAFHNALATAVAECTARFGRAILIDIHGQGRVPDSIVRGTRNGQTVGSLLARSGTAAVIGPYSILGQLQAAGYSVLPSPPDGAEVAPSTVSESTTPSAVLPQNRNVGEFPLARETFFTGGYITAHYGSQNKGGVDSIQLEFGKARRENTLKTARDLGDAIAVFTEYFMIEHPLPPR